MISKGMIETPILISMIPFQRAIIHLKSVTRYHLILQNSASSQSVQKGNIRTLQPLQPRPKHLLSNRSRSKRMQKSTKIPSAHRPLMYLDLLNSLSLNRFVTDFHNLSSATSPTRQATNAFPSPLGNQCNGDHLFLRREYWSRWISVATHPFWLAQNSFLAILAIYYF